MRDPPRVIVLLGTLNCTKIGWLLFVGHGERSVSAELHGGVHCHITVIDGASPLTKLI